MKRLLLAFALAVSPALASAAPGTTTRPMTHEDLWLMPRVGAPQVSPDGRFAVFQVNQPAYEKDKGRNHLWIVPTDGSAPARPLTSASSGESGVSWSADGRRIAFSAKRNGDKEAQVWILDLASGGEAIRVTNVASGASAPKLSPDGTRVLFSSRVYPEARDLADHERIAKEREERKYNARVYTGFPIRYWDKWLDEKQTRLYVQDLPAPGSLQDDRKPPRDLLAGSRLLALPGFSLGGGDGEGNGGATWTPDGKAIVFAASRNRDRSAWSFTHSDLFVVAAEGGEPRRLTGSDALDAADSHGAPVFSADGKRLFASYTPRTGKVFNATRVQAYEWPSMQRVGRIELPQANAVASFAPDPGGQQVYLTGEDAGQEKLYVAPASGGTARLAAAPGRGAYAGLSVGGSAAAPVLVATHDSSTEPPEVVRLYADGRPHTRLTELAVARAAALDLSPAEHFWFDNDRGQRIHNMLVRPARFDPRKRYPLLVLMHGGPHTQWRDQWVLRWNYHLLAQDKYVVLLTNYVGSTGFGEAFAQAIQGDPLKGPADDINRAADEAIARYPFIDGSRQAAGGASYGGHLANWLQGTTTRYKALVSHAGLVNLEAQWGTSDVAYSREVNNGGPAWEQGPVWREQNPIRLAASFRTPVLVTFGEKDYRVPLNNGLEYWAALQRQQVESRLVIFPDENHHILSGENSRYFYREVSDWLQRWLQPR